MKLTINNESAESIGRPIIESIVKAHAESDYDLLVKCLANRKEIPTLDMFNEAVDNLKPLGEVVSIEYLGHLKKPQEHMLLWKVQHEQGCEDILWHLFLSDDDGDIKTLGLMFDR